MGAIEARMKALAPFYFGPGASRLLPGSHAPRAFFTGTDKVSGVSTIYFNEARMGADAQRFMSAHGVTLQEYVNITMIHEFIHVVMDQMALSGDVDFSWFGNANLVHDTIHRPLGLHNRSCGTDDAACGASCGLAESLAKRLTGCLEEGRVATAADIRCDFQVDYCADRVNGGVTGFSVGNQCHGSPDVNANSECFAVTCLDSGSTSSACCDSMAGGALPAGVYIPRVDPGPMPPRPGFFTAGLPWASLPPP